LQHQVRVASNHVDRVKLDTPDVADKTENPGLAGQRPGRPQVVVRQQKPPRVGLGQR